MTLGLLAFVTAALMPASGRAAEQDSTRKITKKVMAAYPATARKMMLTGTVRLAAMVAAAGEVKSTEPLGGHPILVLAATEAAMKWKYQAADQDSKELMVFTFAP
jgi:outer membrane biosynthesis protein TonB